MKIPVGILGATGMVGQKFIELLSDHPWFEIVALGASDRSIGKSYSEASKWRMNSPLSTKFSETSVQACHPNWPCQIVFSGLDASVAGEIEENFANAGYFVISNSRNHRMHPTVPLMIPEVNSDHLQLLHQQTFRKGKIVTNPNCAAVGLATALKPIHDRYQIEKIHVVTLQAVSGAGYPGISSFDIIDNVIPYISGEEEKIETETLKILGKFENGQIQPASITISAQCNRVPVMDGHMACISIQTKKRASEADILQSWEEFSSLDLPSAPLSPVMYLKDETHPQPKLHRDLGDGMSVSIGRLRKCPLFDWKFAILSHNTIRGAAGCAILNAELMVKQGYLTDSR